MLQQILKAIVLGVHLFSLSLAKPTSEVTEISIAEKWCKELPKRIENFQMRLKRINETIINLDDLEDIERNIEQAAIDLGKWLNEAKKRFCATDEQKRYHSTLHRCVNGLELVDNVERECNFTVTCQFYPNLNECMVKRLGDACGGMKGRAAYAFEMELYIHAKESSECKTEFLSFLTKIQNEYKGVW